MMNIHNEMRTTVQEGPFFVFLSVRVVSDTCLESCKCWDTLEWYDWAIVLQVYFEVIQVWWVCISLESLSFKNGWVTSFYVFISVSSFLI